MAFDISDYNTVPERIIEFREKYPSGTLQRVGDLQLLNIGSTSYLVYTAAAYRTPDDPRPGIGSAWEVVPGLTPYTINSELQNAETSAWGRAIIAVGAADAKKGIASREDVQNRRAEQDLPPVPGFRTSLIAARDKLSEAERELLREWLKKEGLPRSPANMDAEESDLVLEYILHGLPKIVDEPTEESAQHVAGYVGVDEVPA